MALIDFHCHLDLYQDPVAVAQRALQEGVYVLSVTTTPSAFIGTSALVPANGRIRTALGFHPELAARRAHELPLFKELLERTGYVGEVGLDASPAHRETIDAQARILVEILDACAAAGGKTISLHSRGATEFLLDLIEVEPEAGCCVLHWFSAKPAIVERASRLGCWFSISSSMIASRVGRTAIEAMPQDRILPETDGPFGTRAGQISYPWDTGYLYQALAECRGVPMHEVERDLTRNFKKLVDATPVANLPPC